MSTRGACLAPRPATKATARPSCSASSGVIGAVFATPRIPSVPNRWGTAGPSAPGEVREARGAPFRPLRMGAGEAPSPAFASPFALVSRCFVLTRSALLVPEVHELQLDRHVHLAHQADDGLQVVPVLAGDAHLLL